MLFIVISHKIKQMPLIDNLQLYFSMSQQENKGLQRIIPVKQSQLRQEKLNSIDALYRAQIRQIYSESKDKINNKEIQSKTQVVQTPKVSEHRVSFSNNVFKSQIQKGLTHAKSYNNILNTQLSSTSRTFQYNEADDKIRASVYLKGESTRTIQILRKQNQLKELKIRQLTSKCQNLIDRLKKYLDPEELEIQLRNIKETSDHKTQRLQKLFKIKNQEIFFKIKLQIIGLLQEFGIKKQQLNDVNEVSNEANLFSFMARKLKNRLKDFKSKQQQSNFEIQKDKVMNQKHEERIHFLIQTNQLLKLSEAKAKNKIEDLKTQLKEYIEKLKIKEQEKQSIQNQVFRLTRQNQQLNIVNQKLNNTLKGVNGDKVDERRVWQAKQKQLKLLLGNYNLQKKKMENQLQQKQGQIEQILIKQKFVQQENDRLNRQLVRWKQRYDWTQQDKQTKLREIEEEKNYIMTQFQNYKNENNQGIIMGHRTQLDEADRQMKQLQREYESALYQIDDQKRLFQRKQEQHEQKMLIMQRQWLNKVKNLQKLKEQELSDIKQDHQNRISQLRQYYERKQQLLAEEMQGRMKAMLAQRDKKMTQQFMLLQNENDHLRQQLQKSSKLLSIKESLLNVIQSKNMSHYEK